MSCRGVCEVENKMEDVRTMSKDLGTVICGEEVGESFEVENEEGVPTTLTVADDESDQTVFAITPRKVRVPPGKTARFRVTFTPHAPNVTYRKEYAIWNDSGITARLELTCTSAGPKVKPTRFNLRFFILRSETVNARRLELENESQCPTKFQFERMGKVDPFEVSQGCGVLPPGGKLILDVRFKPSQLGVFCRRVYCLLQYHPPILFILTGVYNPKLKIEPNRLTLQRFCAEEDTDNYRGYMGNLNEGYVAEVKEPCPEFTRQAKAVVRFADEQEEGPTLKSGEDAAKSITDGRPILTRYYADAGSSPSLGVSLVNLSDSEVRFDWSNVDGKSFAITPRSGHLMDREKLDLTVHFSPDCPDRLYAGDLDVRIFPVAEVPADVIPVPVTLSLSIVGHSFAAESNPWLEQCEIEPRELILLSCVPGDVAYGTLLVRRRGHLPVVFRFIPPEESYVKIKPPLGYISSSYQLFVVQFDATTKPPGEYSEDWRVSYNSSTRYYGHLRITARVEHPTIIFGQGNAFEFDVTLPGGTSKSSVPVRNPTRLKLRYEFSIPEHNQWAEIPVPVGELDPLATGWVDVVFRPCLADEYSDRVVCTSRAVAVPTFAVATEATPPSHDFGTCLYGTQHMQTFHVFNFTPILMHYQLTVTSEEILEEETKCEVTVTPDRGSIPGKSKIQVQVRVTPYSVEPSKQSVRCRLLASEDGGPLPEAPVRALFNLKIEGTLPTFQIIDLNVEGGGPLISPDWLWRMMGVNRLNERLRRMRPGEEVTEDVRLPEATADSSPIIIHLLMEARNLHGMTVDIERAYCNHSCGSATRTTDAPGSGSNFMALSPARMFFEPRSRKVLKLALTYEALGATTYMWKVTLPQNRVINLRTAVHALPVDQVTQTSMYLGPNVHLRPVFIGDLNPPVQLFWLYNNTPSPAAYVLDKMALRESTSPFPNIFCCDNPNGVLPPYSSLPLLLKFVPNELREYKADVQLCLNTGTREVLRLTGCGVLNYSPIPEFGHERTVPEKPILGQSYIGLEPSVKVITLAPFATFTSVERLFFLKNTSENKEWAFQWHSFNVVDTLRAYVEPSEGKLSPGKKLLLRLHVESFRHSANLSVSVPCDVIDYTALEAYESALKLSEDVTERFTDHFTITEKGTFNSVPQVEIPRKPETCHIFITIRTNIVAESSIEFKLHPKDILKLPIGSEIVSVAPCQPVLDKDAVRVVNLILEKVIWQILNSSRFDRHLASYQELHGDTTYLDIRPAAGRGANDLKKALFACPPKNLIQRVIRDTIADILSRRFRE